MVHCVQQHPEVVVADDGRRYVARTYAAPRPDGRWDGWFVFLPFEGGRELATNWETTQQTLAHVKYWSQAISTVYLEGAPQTRLFMLSGSAAGAPGSTSRTGGSAGEGRSRRP